MKINPPIKEVGININEENLAAKSRGEEKEEIKSHKNIFFLKSHMNNFKKQQKKPKRTTAKRKR